MIDYEAVSFKKLQSCAYEYDNYTIPLFPRFKRICPDSTKLSQLQCFPIIGNIGICIILSRFILHATGFACLSTSTKLRMAGMCFAMFVLGFIPFFNVWLVYKVQPLYMCWRWFSSDIGSKGLYHGMSEIGMLTQYITAEANAAQRSSHLTMSSIGDSNRSHSSLAPSTVTLNESPPISGNKYSSKSTSKYQSTTHGTVNFYPSVDKPYPKVQRLWSKSQASSQHANRSGYSSFCPVPTNRSTVAESENDTQSTHRKSYESARVSVFPEEADFLKSNYPVRQSAIDNWPLKDQNPFISPH
ncbi:hypothetical protein H4R20_006167 [Coemansia guatemalensis]|uniref:Uncharacterized protein n=1 Tax=Coemansia guatemalensis TaxID=2761395 RepID=A0A9W8HQB7_9FUNG|nr:hypothetical protein H4R20_006167 [Coemansia guatemalensis]